MTYSNLCEKSYPLLNVYKLETSLYPEFPRSGVNFYKENANPNVCFF